MSNLRDILKGEYKDSPGVILQSADLQKLSLNGGPLLSLEDESLSFSDQNWQTANASKK